MSDPRRHAEGPYTSPHGDSTKSSNSTLKAVIAAIVGILSAIYLINPTAGIIEFIPDNIPFVGNLDEATATALLLSSLAYFGWDLRTIFGRRNTTIHEDRRTIDHRGPASGE